MSHPEQYDYRALAALLGKISLEEFTGKVTCQSTTQTCELYFKRGQLTHAASGSRDGDQVVYDLLAWGKGVLKVESGVETAEQTLDREEVKLIQDTVKLLQTKGSFDQTLAPSAQLNPKKPTELTPGPPATPVRPKETGKLEVPAESSFSIETNLLLPPGTRQNQLEELIQQVNFKEQIQTLSSLHFTGCVYYRTGSKQADRRSGVFGLVLFNNGDPTDIVYAGGSTETHQTGRQALTKLLEQNFIPEIYKVEERVLKAYRGLVICDKSMRDIKATQANLFNLMQALKQARRDGVIILYLDSLKLHYFFLVENGEQVGIFGPDFNSGQLQPLSAPLALPAADTKARMTVMIATRPSALHASRPAESDQVKEISQGIQNQPTTGLDRELDAPAAPKAGWRAGETAALISQTDKEPAKPQTPAAWTKETQEPEAVDWNSVMAEAAPRVRTKETANKSQTDNSNPFDF